MDWKNRTEQIFYDVDVQNSNMDIIDKQMKANANAITQLNSDKEYKTYSTDGISIEINSQCAMFYIRKSKSLTGGNTTQTLLDLPNGITLKMKFSLLAKSLTEAGLHTEIPAT